MSTRIVCPNCHTSYNATDDQRGRRVRCKQCQAIFHAPLFATTGFHLEAASSEPESNRGGKLEALAAEPSAAPMDDTKEQPGVRSRAPKRKARIPRLVLFLILGGVGGSLLI